MWFILLDNGVFSDSNIATMLPTFKVMGYLFKNPTNNEIAQTNSISQHTSAISEYLVSVTDSVTVFWLREHHAMTNPLIRTMYLVTILQSVIISCAVRVTVAT